MKLKGIICALMCAITFTTPMVSAASVESTDEVAVLGARIAELEAEVTMLRDRQAKLSLQAEIILFESDKIERCDINGDRLIDATDASIILQAYALLSTGERITKISDVVNYDYRIKLEGE